MKVTSTFSVAGRCSATGALGAIVTSSSPAVGARCSWVKSDTGVVLTQNVTDPRLANIGLTALEQGYTAQEALLTMKATSKYSIYRQLAVVDQQGQSAVYTGEQALGTSGEFASENVAAVGNLLSRADIPQAMGEEFLSKSSYRLEERLLLALEKGFSLGGELDQEHSLALLVFYPESPFAYLDLRVDYSENPLEDFKRLWKIYYPQADDYQVRALNPTVAPSYGVKGDL